MSDRYQIMTAEGGFFRVWDNATRQWASPVFATRAAAENKKRTLTKKNTR